MVKWSPTGEPVAPSCTPVGRNPEQEPPAKAGAHVEGLGHKAQSHARQTGFRSRLGPTMKAVLRNIFFLAMLTLLGLVAYLNSLPNGFHFDDYPTIVENGAIRSLKLIPAYFVDTTTWTLSPLRDWRPVVLVTFALNYRMGGIDPVIFRLTNLVLHIATSLFLFLILKDILSRPAARLAPASPRTATGLALSAALLFLVHTANSEVVNYIFARSTLLATFFYAGAFYCYLRGPFSEGRAHSRLWHIGGLSAFALGLASKATIISLPLNLMCFEVIFLNPSGQNPLRLYRAEPWTARLRCPLHHQR